MDELARGLEAVRSCLETQIEAQIKTQIEVECRVESAVAVDNAYGNARRIAGRVNAFLDEAVSRVVSEDCLADAILELDGEAKPSTVAKFLLKRPDLTLGNTTVRERARVCRLLHGGKLCYQSSDTKSRKRRLRKAVLDPDGYKPRRSNQKRRNRNKDYIRRHRLRRRGTLLIVCALYL